MEKRGGRTSRKESPNMVHGGRRTDHRVCAKESEWMESTVQSGREDLLSKRH